MLPERMGQAGTNYSMGDDQPGALMSTDLQIGTFVLAAVAVFVSAVGLIVSVLSYRLGVRNQVAPLRQELYRRQADGMAEIVRVMIKTTDYAHGVLLSILSPTPDLKDGLKDQQPKLDKSMSRLLQLMTVHAPFLSDDFLKETGFYYGKVHEAIAKARTAALTPKTFDKMRDVYFDLLRVVYKRNEDVIDSARRATGTPALTESNRTLFDLHDRRPFFPNSPPAQAL